MNRLSYSNEIKRLRVERAWPQEQLSAISGVSTRTIQRIENGEAASFDTLKAIATAFSIDVTELVNAKEESGNKPHDVNFLVRITSGTELFKIVFGADGYQFDNDTLENETEVELVSNFLQDLHDWAELGDDVGPGQRVKIAHEFNARIAEIEAAGLWIFGLRIPRRYRTASGPVSLSIATVSIMRSTNPTIIGLGPLREALAK
jgi:transcriptional regulator with XRE-family HTH domain